LPSSVVTVAGRVAWNDAGNTPNVHYAIYETDTFPTLIALSNLADKKGGSGSWDSKAGRPASGPASGYVVACEGGYLLGQRQTATAMDRKGKTIRQFTGGEIVKLHVQNFFDAMRSRRSADLNAEVQIGHYSSGWCNLANVGYQTSTTFDADQLSPIGSRLEAWPRLVEELKSQLKPHGLNVSALRVSPKLRHDPKTELFVGDHAALANGFLKRTYRSGFEVPEIA